MITAVFTSGFDHTEVSGLWQYDYGQKLRIQGLNLPPAVEIHFSLNKSGGNSESRVGITKDGVTDVPIPDSMLENGGSVQNYYIYAFIYITDETSGKTVKWVQLHVNSRPKPEAFDSPEEKELFKEAIAAVNESAGRAETAQRIAEEAKEQVAKDKEEVLLAKNAVKESEKNVTENKEYVRRTVENFTSLAENAVDNVNIAGQNQVNNIEKAGQAALDNISTGVDETLTQSGKAADAKKTGERIDELNGDLANIPIERLIDMEGGNRVTKDYYDLYVNSYMITDTYLDKGLIQSVFFEIEPLKKYKISTVGVHNRFKVYLCNSKVVGTTIEILVERNSTGNEIFEFINTDYKYVMVYVCNDGIIPERITITDNERLSFNGLEIAYKNEIIDLSYGYFVAEISNVFVNNGSIINLKDENIRACVIKVDKNKRYSFTVSGKRNRFFVSGLVGEVVVGNTTTTIYNDGQIDEIGEKTFTYINTEYDYLIVGLGYGCEDFSAVLTYIYSDIDGYKINDVTFLSKDETLKEIERYKTKSYVSSSDISNISDTTELYLLYDALLAEYPNYVSKNVLGQNSLGQNIIEYVFSHGKYNSKTGIRGMDAEIDKPIILLITGVHGDERTSIMSTYQFLKDLCECNTRLYELRENTIFKVIPLVCPYGFDNNSRTNENGVNINRNFNINWSASYDVENNKSGTSPADQLETQIVQNWIDSNINATIFIDFHNSGFQDEVSYLAGNSAISEMTIMKKSFLQGIGDFSPYLESEKGFVSENLIMAYTGDFGQAAMSYRYAEDKNILSVCLECSWNQNSSGLHSNLSIKTGAECLGNMLLGIRKYSDLLN